MIQQLIINSLAKAVFNMVASELNSLDASEAKQKIKDAVPDEYIDELKKLVPKEFKL